MKKKLSLAAFTAATLLTTSHADVTIDFGEAGQAVATVADVYPNFNGSPAAQVGTTSVVYPLSGAGASGTPTGSYLLLNFYELDTTTLQAPNYFDSGLGISDLENDYIYMANGNQVATTVEICNLASILSASTTYTIYMYGQGDNADQGSAFVFDVNDITDPSVAGVVKETADTGNSETDIAASYTFTTPATVPDSLKFDWYRAFEGDMSNAGFAGIPAITITGETIEGSFVPGAASAFSVNGDSVTRAACDFPASDSQLGGFTATYASLPCELAVTADDPGVAYVSNDLSVCTVSATGAVTPTGTGSTTIDVSFGGQTDSVPVTVTLAFAPAAAAVHRYSFNSAASVGPEAGTTEPDLIGSADGTVWEAQWDGSGKLLFDEAGGACPHVDLPNGIFTDLHTANGSFTIEWWAETTFTGSWSRYFSFGESTTTGDTVANPSLEVGEHDETCPRPSGNGKDYFDIVAEHNNTSRLSVESRETPGGATNFINQYGPYTANTQHHWVVVYDAECGEVALYQNGSKVDNYTGAFNRDLSNINDVNCWIGRPAWNGNTFFDGSFDEARFYTGVMNGLQISQSFAAGPDALTLLPDPGNLTDIEVTPETLTIAKASVEADRQLTTIANFTIAGPLDVTTLGDVVYTSSDPAVVTVDAGLITVVGDGSATITIEYAHPTNPTASDTVSVTVEALSSVAVTGSNSVSIDTVEGIFPTLQLGATADFNTLTGLDVSADPTNVWASSDPGVATVDANGLVTPVAAGSTNITVEYCGVLSAIHTVTVSAIVAKPPVLKHHYTFNYPDGTTASPVEDSTGGADGVVINSGHTYTSGALVLPGGTIVDNDTTAPFVDLPNNIITDLVTANGEPVTIEFWVTWQGSGNWRRVFSFGSSAEGEGLSGTGQTYWYFTPQNNGGVASSAYTNNGLGNQSVVLADTIPLTNGSQSHVVVTYDSDDGVAKMYIDNFFTSWVTIPAGSTLSALDDVNCWLGRAQWGDPLPPIDIDEFNIYCGVFSAADVAASNAAGPDTTTELVPPAVPMLEVASLVGTTLTVDASGLIASDPYHFERHVNDTTWEDLPGTTFNAAGATDTEAIDISGLGSTELIRLSTGTGAP